MNRDNLKIEYEFKIEVAEHASISALTSHNKEKRVVLLNGEFIGKVNRMIGKKTWEAEYNGKTVAQKLQTKGQAIQALVGALLIAEVDSGPSEAESEVRKTLRIMGGRDGKGIPASGRKVQEKQSDGYQDPIEKLKGQIEAVAQEG